MRILTLFSLCWFIFSPAIADEPAKVLIKKALEAWRGATSYAELSMTIHRPDYERHLKLISYTQGQDSALAHFTAPPKDAGNATLQLNHRMYLFTPKVNRVIQLPSAMMNQSWMGSDFSYDELARGDRILQDYDHQIIATETKPFADKTYQVYQIQSIPHATAPVVWGKVVVTVREDGVFLKQAFYDQKGQLIKEMTTDDLHQLKRKNGLVWVPFRYRVVDLKKKDHWTQLEYKTLKFDIAIPAWVISKQNLQHFRPWKPH